MVVVNKDEVNSSFSSDKDGDTNEAKNKIKTHRNDKQKFNKSRSIPSTENNPEILYKKLMEAFKKLCFQLKRIFNFIMIDLGGYQIADRFAQWCVQHPQLAICLLAAGLVIWLPILLFAAFVLSTIVMTFTGFLVLEGTLLTILTMILFGLLCALGTVFLFFVIVGFATYFGVSDIYDIYGTTETESTNVRNVAQSND